MPTAKEIYNALFLLSRVGNITDDTWQQRRDAVLAVMRKMDDDELGGLAEVWGWFSPEDGTWPENRQ